MIKIAVCDDDKRIREDIISLLGKGDNMNIYSISAYASAQEFLSAARAMFFDIVFLDIEMQGMNGIEAGMRIRQMEAFEQTLIIFVSSHKEHAIKTFDVMPFHFIEKPIDEKKFWEIFQKALKRVEQSQEMFLYRKGKGEMYRWPLHSIYVLSSYKRKIIIRGVDREDEFFGKLTDVEEQLKQLQCDSFIRIHRCVIVNLDHVKEFRNPTLVMDAGEEEFTVSRSYERQSLEQVMRYCGRI